MEFKAGQLVRLKEDVDYLELRKIQAKWFQEYLMVILYNFQGYVTLENGYSYKEEWLELMTRKV